MSKRVLFSALSVVVILSLIAYLRIGGEETLDQTDLSSTTAPVPTATQAPDVKASAAITPSLTQVATAGELFLQMVEPVELEVFTDLGSMTVAGRTRVDAIVTINDTMVEPNIDGEFSLDVPLEEGPNIIEVVASVASGEQMDLVLVVIYLP